MQALEEHEHGSKQAWLWLIGFIWATGSRGCIIYPYIEFLDKNLEKKNSQLKGLGTVNTLEDILA
jgi:hypothetical protein